MDKRGLEVSEGILTFLDLLSSQKLGGHETSLDNARGGPSAKLPTGQKGQQLPKLGGPNRIQLALTILKE